MHTITYRMDKQGPTVYSTRNYIHYPVINQNGKEYEKDVTLLYNRSSHIAQADQLGAL